MDNLDFSVIIPVYNQKQYLSAAIHSVLTQTVTPLEIMVIDDGSTDDIGEAVELEHAAIRYYRQDHQGAAAARNFGASLAKGRWLAFLDADDLWLPQKIELQWACAKEQNISIVFSHIQQFISPEFCVDRLARQPLKNEIMPGYCASTLLIKKEVFAEIGHFDCQYQLGEFIAWYLRMQKSDFECCLLDDVLVKRRIHRNNTSSRNKMARQDYLRLLYQSKNSGMSEVVNL